MFTIAISKGNLVTVIAVPEKQDRGGMRSHMLATMAEFGSDTHGMRGTGRWW
jgi:hypothetical protein